MAPVARAASIGEQRNKCEECLSIDEIVQHKMFCACTKRLSTCRIRAGLKQCAECDPSVVDRVEIVIRPLLLARVKGKAAGGTNPRRWSSLL
jgi:hypothetical protein